MRFVSALLAVSLLCAFPAATQQTSLDARSAATANHPGAASVKPIVTDTIEVRTTVEPLPMAESNRSVEVITPRDVPAMLNSPVDLLRSDSSLNLQAQ